MAIIKVKNPPLDSCSKTADNKGPKAGPKNGEQLTKMDGIPTAVLTKISLTTELATDKKAEPNTPHKNLAMKTPAKDGDQTVTMVKMKTPDREKMNVTFLPAYSEMEDMNKAKPKPKMNKVIPKTSTSLLKWNFL